MNDFFLPTEWTEFRALIHGLSLLCLFVLAAPIAARAQDFSIVSPPADLTVFAPGNATFSVTTSNGGPFTYQWRFNGTNLPDNIINTVAGRNGSGYNGDGILATNAALSVPTGVAVDGAGNIYIADKSNQRIRKVDPNGVITTVVGMGAPGFYGDGGVATSARLNSPFSVAFDGAGNLFITDQGNQRIRRVDTNGIITTVAGNGTSGFSGDGSAATNAALHTPRGIAADHDGNLFIADYLNNRVRRVDTNGVIATVAGNGSTTFSGDGGAATNAPLYNPTDVAVDAAGNLFICDQGHERIRRVDTNGIITTLAGNGLVNSIGDGGSATNAGLYYPYGITVDPQNDLFITEYYGQKVRMVDAYGTISTVAGTNASGFSGDGGTANNARLSTPYDVASDADNDFYIADTGNNRIRKVTNFGPVLTLNQVSSASAGNYSVVITDSSGSVTSAVATLTVLVRPTITSQPASKVIVNGSPATFSVSAYGTGDLAYQWQLSGTNLSDTANLSGTTTSNLTIQACSTNDAGNYTVAITNAYGATTSAPANLTIVFPPAFTTGPTDTFAVWGTPAALSVEVSGTGPFIYQWQHDGTNLPNNIITTIAGNGTTGFAGDGGPATNAVFFYPLGMAMNSAGNLYIVDELNERLRRIAPNGIITTVAGNGTDGYSGDGGQAVFASLSTPQGAAVDAANNIYISEAGNQRIRKVDAYGYISTFAGNGTAGYAGDGGPATSASLNYPNGMAMDPAGGLLVADSGNARIRRIGPDGIITTVAGNGAKGAGGDGGAATNASLNYPEGVDVDAQGDIFIADMGNNRVREVDTNGIITTIAGSGAYAFSGDGGPAINAALNQPIDVHPDNHGNVFIVDSHNNCIRMIDTNGIINTIAGRGGGIGYTGDGIPATYAYMNTPWNIVFDSAGNYYLSDSSNQRVRKVVPPPGGPVWNINRADFADAGTYSIIVTGPYGSITSSIVNVTLTASPLESPMMMSGTNVEFSFQTVTGKTYMVQYSDSLNPPAWTNLPPIPGDGTIKAITNADVGVPQRFYRLSEQ